MRERGLNWLFTNQRRGFANMLMIPPVPNKIGNMTSLETVSFSTRPLLHGLKDSQIIPDSVPFIVSSEHGSCHEVSRRTERLECDRATMVGDTIKPTLRILPDTPLKIKEGQSEYDINTLEINWAYDPENGECMLRRFGVGSHSIRSRMRIAQPPPTQQQTCQP